MAEMEGQIHRENEAILDALGNNVAHMKRLAGRLNNEAQSQNTLLSGLSTSFNTARRGVGQISTRVDGVVRVYGRRHTCYFTVGFLAVLLFLYYILRK